MGTGGIAFATILIQLFQTIYIVIKLNLISLFTKNKDIVRLTIEYLNIEIFTIPAYAVLSSSINTLQAIKLTIIPIYATPFTV